MELKEIASHIRAYVDKILSGEVPEDFLVREHQIPAEAFMALRDADHPSHSKMRERVFCHLMGNIGYYSNLNNADWNLAMTPQNLDYALTHPAEYGDIRPMLCLPYVYGVKDAIRHIESLSNPLSFRCQTKVALSGLKYGKEGRGYKLHYNREWNAQAESDTRLWTDSLLTIDGREYQLPEDGVYLSRLSRNFTQPDEVEYTISRMQSVGLNSQGTYFMRYITAVPKDTDIVRTVGWHGHDIDGADTYCIEVTLEGMSLLAYIYNLSGKTWLVVDSDAKLSVEEMENRVFSFLVALGMFTCKIHLNECWVFASEDKSFQSYKGLSYHALSETVGCQYSIVTTNVYSVLAPVGQKIDPVEGEHRAIRLIDSLKLRDALPHVGFDVFSSIVRNFDRYESLRRGIFLILSGTSLALELQPGAFSIALESLANVTKDIIGNGNEHFIDAREWEDRVKPRFVGLSRQLMDEGLIDQAAHDAFCKKINGMNNNFNADRLRALLEHFNYQFSKFDELTLRSRNTFLHGSIHVKDKAVKGVCDSDALFQFSLNLHKLCCCIVLLMAGYKGYIINNRKLYGYDKSCKSFIKIG